jgi:DUF3047 family protein
MKRSTLTLFILTFALPAWSGDLAVGRFSAADLAGWRDKSFHGKTVYSLAKDDGRTVLQARSKHAASGLVRELEADPKQYPLLRWSWKVAHTLSREDVTKKSGDDFAARVYVVFQRTFFWRMRAINYVWSANMEKGAIARNAFTANAAVVAVESGDGKAGEWLSEERNIYEDYRKIFGEEPPPVGAIAVMTDTDNTQDEVTAWYGDISLAEKK